MNIYKVYDLDGNVVTEGTSKEIKSEIGMNLGVSITQYAFGFDLFRGKYLILDSKDKRDVKTLLDNRRGKRNAAI